MAMAGGEAKRARKRRWHHCPLARRMPAAMRNEILARKAANGVRAIDRRQRHVRQSRHIAS